jgi:hypothetical protein
MISFDVHTAEDGYYHVTAFEMTDKQFKVRCKCKKGYHLFGNCGDAVTNRTEYRSSHCPETDLCNMREMAIHITEQTVRKLKSKPKQ